MTYILNKNNNKLYYEIKNQEHYSSTKPFIVFLHGYSSSCQSTKALFVKELCLKHNLPFIAFDLSASGQSEGDILNASVETWLDDVEIVLEKLSKNKQKLIIGSSLGGWLAMLYCIKNPSQVHSLLALAPAPDFHTDMLNSFDKNQLKTLKEQGYLKLQTDPQYDGLIVPYNLLLNAKNFALLQKSKIAIQKPITILQGMKDSSVHYSKSIEIIEKIESEKANLILCKESNHGLSSPSDLQTIKEQIFKLIN